MKNGAIKNTNVLHGRNRLPHRACQLLFQVLELLRKLAKSHFTDWKDADDWIFSELDITKAELKQIYDGRDTLYYDASAVDVQRIIWTRLAVGTLKTSPNFCISL